MKFSELMLSWNCRPKSVKAASAYTLSPTESKVKSMAQPKVPSTRHVEILVVESDPSDTLPILEGFKAAGLTNVLHCVTDGEDTVSYVRREDRYVSALKAINADTGVDAHSDCGCSTIRLRSQVH